MFDLFYSSYFNTVKPMQFIDLYPQYSVKETDTEHRIEVVAPSVRKEELTLSVEDSELSIKFTPQDSAEKTAKALHVGVRRPFNLTYKLKSNIEVDKITSTLELGVLVIQIPKPEPNKVVLDIN